MLINRILLIKMTSLDKWKPQGHFSDTIKSLICRLGDYTIVIIVHDQALEKQIEMSFGKRFKKALPA